MNSIDEQEPVIEVEPKKQIKMIGYVSALYDTMSNEASDLDVEGRGELVVWQGRLIQTCTSVGIPQGYYKRVVDTLRALGCIEVITRGRRGSTLTAIILRYPPTQELYEEAIVKSGWDRLTAAASPDMLAAQMRDIQKSLGGMNIVEAMANFEERVSALETAVRGLSNNPHNQHNS